MQAPRTPQLLIASAALAAALVAVTTPTTGDYTPTQPDNPDNAAPAIRLLIDGQFGDVPGVQPLMGLASILLRLPFAAIGDRIGGLEWEHWLGSFACAWALALLALTAAVARRNRSRVTAVAVVVLIVAGPATYSALDFGHPEELLLSAAAAGAVWAAAAARANAAGWLTAVAIGTKPFGILALAPLFLARRVGAVRSTVIAAAGGLLLVAPLPLLDPNRYWDGSRQLADLIRVYPPSLWYPLGQDRERVISIGDELAHLTVKVMPTGLTRGSGVLLATLVGAITLAALLRRLGARNLGLDALAMLALIFLARALFDPQNLEYYALPGLVALTTWEALARPRAPVMSAAAAAGVYVSFHAGLHGGAQSAVFLVTTLSLTAYLVAVLARSKSV